MSRIYSFFTLPCFRTIIPLPIDGIYNWYIVTLSLLMYLSLYLSAPYAVLGFWFYGTIWSIMARGRHGYEYS